MNGKTIVTFVLGIALGVALSASVMTVMAQHPEDRLPADSLQRILAQNTRMLEGQQQILSNLSDIKSDVQFIKSNFGRFQRPSASRAPMANRLRGPLGEDPAAEVRRSEANGSGVERRTRNCWMC